MDLDKKIANAPKTIASNIPTRNRGHALDVTARARISIPEPGSADSTARLVDPQLESELTQAVNRIEAPEPGTYDRHIEMTGPLHRFLLPQHFKTKTERVEFTRSAPAIPTTHHD
jgi:hypothetical protein